MKLKHYGPAVIIAFVVAAGVYAVWRNAKEDKQTLLIDVRLNRSVSREPRQARKRVPLEGKPQVTRLRFLARTNAPVSVSLPVDEKSGCALCFVPRLEKDEFVLHDVYLAYCDLLSSEFGKTDWEDEHNLNQAVGGAIMRSAIDSHLKVSNWGIGLSGTNIDYQVLVSVSPVERAQLRAGRWSTYEYKGEVLHFLQNAHPYLMEHGVTRNAGR